MSADITPPGESYARLFSRFLRFGLLAWGGPVAQIAMIRQELVDEERWMSHERFNRVLAVYQILPGPEATELCVHFGFLSRGRIGGVVAGLGFVLPGFLSMLALSWFYLAYGIQSAVFASAFQGIQAAVAALVVRAVHRIGGHTLHDRWLWGIAGVSVLMSLTGVNFLITLSAAGLVYMAFKRSQPRLSLLIILASLLVTLLIGGQTLNSAAQISEVLPSEHPAPLFLFGSGLRSGLLTFGGAYTVIPYLRSDAVGHWMTGAQFLDGLGLSGMLPAPLVIFGTFVGYLGGGLGGALLVTIGIFLPAFAFTLVGHRYLARAVENQALHSFLDGVTAGVVGLISVTALTLLRDAITSPPAAVIFAVSLLLLFRWKSKIAVPLIVLGAAVIGWVIW